MKIKWSTVMVLAMLTGAMAAPNQVVPKGLGEWIKIPGLISYQVPQGWTTSDEVMGSPEGKGPISNGMAPTIAFNPSNYGSLADFLKDFQPEFYDTGLRLKVVSHKDFVTAAGVKGMRVTCIDPATPPTMEQFSYIFLSSDGQQLEVACTCAAVDANVYGPVFDGAMKSVVIAKGD